MEHGKQPEQEQVNEVQRTLLAAKISEVAKEFGIGSKSIESFTEDYSSTSDTTPTFDTYTENLEAIFRRNGAYISVTEHSESVYQNENSLGPALQGRTVSNVVRIATPLIYEHETYWNVEQYSVENGEVARFDEMLYSDKGDTTGQWTQFIPAPTYDALVLGVPQSKEQLASLRERATLTTSRYQRVMMALTELNQSHVMNEVPEVFSKTGFKSERSDPIA